MKTSPIALALALALAAAPLLPASAQQAPAQTREQKKAAKLKRRERQPDVYKGNVAKQARVVSDTPDTKKNKGEEKEQTRDEDKKTE